MMHSKMFGGLLAVAATALMVFAATASATQVTAPAGTLYTGHVEAINEGSITISGTATVHCNSSLITGTVTAHGSNVTASGPVTALTFTNCDQHVVVKATGTFEAHATSGGNGTLTSNKATVTIEFTTIFGNIHCNLETRDTDVGDFTAAPSSTSHATIHLNKQIPVEVGSVFLCGSSATLTGSYKVQTPTGLRLD